MGSTSSNGSRVHGPASASGGAQGGASGGVPLQRPRCRRIFATTSRWSITAITRMGCWHWGQNNGSVCQTCRMRSRHFFDGERVAEDVLGELLQLGLVLGRDGFAVVDVEAGVFPG